MNAGATRSAGKGSHPERRVALTALAATTAAIVQMAGSDETVEAGFVRALARLGSPAVTVPEVVEPGGSRTCLEVAASAIRAGSVASGGRGGSSVAVVWAGRGVCVAAAAPASSAGSAGLATPVGRIAPVVSGASVGRIRPADAAVVIGGLAGAATGSDACAVDGPGGADAVDASVANVAAAAASADATRAVASADVVDVADATRVADFDFFFVLADGHCPDRYATASGPFSSASHSPSLAVSSPAWASARSLPPSSLRRVARKALVAFRRPPAEPRA